VERLRLLLEGRRAPTHVHCGWYFEDFSHRAENNVAYAAQAVYLTRSRRMLTCAPGDGELRQVVSHRTGLRADGYQKKQDNRGIAVIRHNREPHNANFSTICA
jgi:hypothetical protein